MSAPSQVTSANVESGPGGTGDGTGGGKPTIRQRFIATLDLSYVTSLFFFLKVATIIMEFCGSISVSARYDTWGSARYYNFVAVTGIVVAVLVILFNLFKIVERLEKVPWMFIELVFDGLWALLMIIAASVVTGQAKSYANMDSFAAAAFFGFASTVLYLVDGGLRLVKLVRSGSGIRLTVIKKAQKAPDNTTTNNNNNAPTQTN